MKNIIKISGLFLLSLLIFSCEKENPIDGKDKIDDSIPSDTNEIIYNYILAGDTSFNVVYNNLEPDVIYEPNQDPFGFRDSIDLDNNGIYDFSIHSLGTDNEQLGYFYTNQISAINNSNEVAISKFNNYPDTLNNNDTIDNRLLWINEGYLTYDDGLTRIYGNWIDINNKFLAIRLISNDTIYGWLRMDIGRYGDYIIYDYALMKKE